MAKGTAHHFEVRKLEIHNGLPFYWLYVETSTKRDIMQSVEFFETDTDARRSIAQVKQAVNQYNKVHVIE